MKVDLKKDGRYTDALDLLTHTARWWKQYCEHEDLFKKY